MKKVSGPPHGFRATAAELAPATAMTAVLVDANEDPAAFLVHSPYVVHELHAV